ncbi:MAG: protein kinase domain-containing protein [Promethearchaeota archaeon]
MPKLKLGDLLGNRYKITGIFGGRGETGMGIVYRCEDLHRKEVIAMKTFQDKYINRKSSIDKFKHEALTWILLGKHPYLVNAYYVIQLRNKIYIALEFIELDEEGRHTLKDFLKKRIPYKQALTWCIQFCIGMEYALSRGIITHFDIKPSNIMITKEKILKISDFGLAKIWDEENIIDDWKEITQKCPEGLTFVCVNQDTKMAGSPLWMAPERYEGRGDIRSDIFSFGVVMYQMVNRGKLPFAKQTLKSYYLNVKNQPIEIIKKDFYPIIEKCLQKNPDKRYQDFAELRQDLSELYYKEFNENFKIVDFEDELTLKDFENRGISFLTLNLTKEAIKNFEKVLEINPLNSDVYRYLGNALKKERNYNKSIEMLQKAIKLKPELADNYYDLANVYKELDHDKKAIELYKKAMELKFDNPKALYKIAQIYDKIEDYKLAKLYYKQFLSIADDIFINFKKIAKNRVKKIK